MASSRRFLTYQRNFDQRILIRLGSRADIFGNSEIKTRFLSKRPTLLIDYYLIQLLRQGCW